MATIICLVTHILSNIFCAHQKKETHIGLKQLEGESIMTFIFFFFWGGGGG